MTTRPRRPLGWEFLLDYFVAITGQRFSGGSCRSLNPWPSDSQPSAMTITLIFLFSLFKATDSHSPMFASQESPSGIDFSRKNGYKRINSGSSSSSKGHKRSHSSHHEKSISVCNKKTKGLNKIRFPFCFISFNLNLLFNNPRWFYSHIKKEKFKKAEFWWGQNFSCIWNYHQGACWWRRNTCHQKR